MDRRWGNNRERVVGSMSVWNETDNIVIFVTMALTAQLRNYGGEAC